MCQQNALDSFRRNFSTGYIDLIAGAASQINQSVGNLREIARAKNAVAQIRIWLRPICKPNSAAADFQTAVLGDGEFNIAHWGAGYRGITSRRFACVVGNSAALARA